MFLSIIIPVYNVEPYIERCMLSVINQIDDNVEVIMVDDCGQDKSLDVVRRIVETHPKGDLIRICKHANNRGTSAARNTGLSNAQGTYVWFVDSDDWITDNCIQYLFSILSESEPDICLMSAARCSENQCIQLYSYPELNRKVVEGKTFITDNKIQLFIQPSIYKRSFLIDNQLQFLIGVFHEDIDFSLRSYYLAKRVMYIDEVFFCYYSNPTSIVNTINPKKSFDLIIVANSLFEFSKSHVAIKHLPSFYNYISLAINNALYSFYKINDHAIKKEWEKKFFENKHLKLALINSSIFKYRLEGFLFKASKRYISIYQFLQLFNKKTTLKKYS